MKSIAVAVAAAGLVGAVAADSTIQWESWSTTESTSAEPTTAASTAWESWTSSATTPVEVTSTTTQATTPVEVTSTTTKATTPVEVTSTASSTASTTPIEWESWSTTESKKADSTTSSIESATWSTTESSKSAEATTSIEWESWSSSSAPKPAATSESSTWAQWSAPAASSGKPAAASSAASSTWAEWESTSTTTIKSTMTVTKTVEPVATSSAETWSEWSSTSSAKVAGSSSAAGWSQGGWFGPAWSSAASGQCVMNVVTSYGYPTWHPTPAATSTPSSSSSWSEWVASTSTSSVKVTETATSSASSTWSVWTESASSSASWSSASPSASGKASDKTSGGSTSLANHGSTWSMTYSPYTASGACKDAGSVSADIAKMASLGFSSVRVYSTDCQTLENVGNACRASNMKMILGVFISNTGINGAQGQVTDITSWAQWDLVELIVVGNEAVFQGFCSDSELAGFISSCKGTFQAAGYTGPVTTTEPLAQWQQSGNTFCDVVDVVGANLYAFFNPDTTADQAGAFIQSEIQELNGICSGKDTYVMESGWPSAGECNGVACPSPENQVTAIKSIQSTSGAKVVFFSFEDDQWKQPGQFGVEQHWGCSNVFDGQWSKW